MIRHLPLHRHPSRKASIHDCLCQKAVLTAPVLPPSVKTARKAASCRKKGRRFFSVSGTPCFCPRGLSCRPPPDTGGQSGILSSDRRRHPRRTAPPPPFAADAGKGYDR